MVESRVDGRNYLVLPEGERFPLKLNRKRLDKALFGIEVSFKKIQALMKELYEQDYDSYVFIRDYVFGYGRFEFDEGSSFHLDDVVDTVVSVHGSLLSRMDEIRPVEEVEMLEDLGYKYYGGGLAHVMYEKVLEDTDEKEVVEEIQQVEGKMVRRIRTTLWEKTSYGKSSRSITYRKIGNTKRLVRAFLNSCANRSG